MGYAWALQGLPYHSFVVYVYAIVHATWRLGVWHVWALKELPYGHSGRWMSENQRNGKTTLLYSVYSRMAGLSVNLLFIN